VCLSCSPEAQGSELGGGRGGAGDGGGRGGAGDGVCGGAGDGGRGGAGDGVCGGMSEDEFYERMRGFLHERRPDLHGDIEPTTQLWETGYLDSFGLIETLTFLEELTGHSIQIGADDLPSFFTMKGIFEAFVAD
jgi:acyl carrier protein